MEKNRQISYTEEFQIIYVDISCSWRWSRTNHFLSDFLPKSTVRKGGRRVT